MTLAQLSEHPTRRSSIREGGPAILTGMARVVDTRVVCVRPPFSTRFCPNPLQFHVAHICAETSPQTCPTCRSTVDLTGGTVTKSSTLALLIVPSLTVLRASGFPGQQVWVLCVVSGGANLVSPLTNATSHEDPTARSFSPLMIIDTTSLHEGGYELWNTSSTWEHFNSSGSGPWLQQWSRARSDDGEAEEVYYFPVTLCVDYAGAAQ